MPLFRTVQQLSSPSTLNQEICTIEFRDMLQSHLLGRHRIVLAGIPCTISFHMADHLYYARWFCGGCSVRSEYEFREQTADGAIEAARSDWLAHHAERHARRA
jgi:hypothetical protein